MTSLRIRVSLNHSDPEIWRTLHLPAELPLPEVHEALQAAFGWVDSHLHSFYLGDIFNHAGNARFFHSRESLDEGFEGEDEARFALGDLLSSPGDVLGYEYDFGDSWHHRLELLDTSTDDAVQRVTCEDGARRGPIEDSGGMGGYAALCETLSDPRNEDYDFYADWVRWMTGSDAPLDPEAFDQDAVNRRLFELFGDASTPGSITPLHAGALEEFAGRMPPRFAQSFRAMIRRAGLIEHADGTEPMSAIDAELSTAQTSDIDRLGRAYRWMLERIGAKGVKLTSAGYLPPAVVGDAMDALGWKDTWIGDSNREVDAFPILLLRESMQQYRLLRKSKGVLLPTPAGRRAINDSYPLMRHLARELPAKQKEEVGRDVTVLLLAFTAGGEGRSADDETLADYLSALGWRIEGYEPVTAEAAMSLAADIRRDLAYMGVLEERQVSGLPSDNVTEAGPVFARAVLAGFDRS